MLYFFLHCRCSYIKDVISCLFVLVSDIYQVNIIGLKNKDVIRYHHSNNNVCETIISATSVVRIYGSSLVMLRLLTNW
jgi:hypothetical protein